MVELLVVMAIIGILMVIMFPAIGSARKAAMRNKAKSDIKTLHAAIKSFKNEYDRYPLHGTEVPDKTDINYNDHDGNALLVSSLRGDLENDNPREIGFINISESSLDDDGRFVDPWDREGSDYGHPYHAMVDSDYDGMIKLEPKIDSHGVTIGVVSNHAIAVWSNGDPDDRKMGPFTSWGGEFVERERRRNE